MRPLVRTLVSTLLAAFVVALVTIPALADAPAATDDGSTTAEDTQLVVDAAGGVLSNDTDTETAILTAQLVDDVQHGTLALDPSGSFTYTPGQDFNGSDSFTYRAFDGADGSNVATVTIGVTPVNDPPVANDDDFGTTPEDTPVTADVLGNDTDSDTGDVLSVQSVADPAHGTATDNGDGTITYTPAADFHGSDSFGYTVSDGNGGTADGTVSVIVSAANDAPAAVDDPSYTTTHDHQLTVAAPGVLGNDTDADGDGLTAVSWTDPGNGSLTPHANGGFDYTPDAGFVGTDTFTYAAFDGTAQSDPATVSVTVTDQAPTVRGQQHELDEDTTLQVGSSEGLLTGAADPENDPLTSAVVDQPDHGTATLQSDGSFDYTPDPNYNGADSFTFHASDGISPSQPASVDLTIDPVEDPPVAAADEITTPEDTSVRIPVLTNDTDPDATDTLTVDLSASTPSNGTVADDAGEVLYTPGPNFNGDATFDYVVDDGHGGTDTGSVTVDVTPVNDAPVAVTDSYQFASASLTTTPANGVLVNDTDVDGPFKHAMLVAGPVLGTLSLHADGSFVYAPKANVCQRNDTFTYKVSDGSLQSAPVTVTLQVRIPRLPATMSLTRSSTAIDYLGTLTMTAHLSAFSAGAKISLSRIPLGGTATPVGTKGVDAKGDVAFTVAGLTKRNTFTATSSFDNCHVTATSPGSIVKVRAKVVGTLAGGHVVKSVRTYRNVNPLYTTRVTPAHPGATVHWQWQIRQGGVWKDYFEPIVTLGDDSSIVFGLGGWTPNVLNRIRAVGPFDASGHWLFDNAPANSTWLEFVVKPA